MAPEVVNALASVAASAVAPVSTNGIVPETNELRAALTNDPLRWDSYIRHLLVDHILPYWNNTTLSPLLSKAIREPSDLVGFVKRSPLDLPRKSKNGKAISPDVRTLEYKLRVNKEFNSGALDPDIVRGQGLVAAFVASGSFGTVASQDSAVRLVTELRAFEGLAIRLAAAQLAAIGTGHPISHALALYRTEGDLVVPMSSEDLLLSLPPIEQNFVGSRVLGANPKPNMSKGVWLMTNKAFRRREGIRTAETIDLEYVKVRALMDWFLIIIGYDILEQDMWHSLQSRNIQEIKNAFGRASNRVWLSTVATSDEAEARRRFQALLDGLFVSELPGSDPIFQVSVVEPVTMVASILAEGLMFMFLGDRVIPDSLRYLHYHTQARFNLADADQDEFRKILISALAAAKRTTDPAFAALKASLSSITFPAKLKYQTIEDRLIAAGWNTSANFELLAQFISSAGRNVWEDWFEHRANFSRYNVTLEYYDALLQP